MPPTALATERDTTQPSVVVKAPTSTDPTDSLFERVAWLYAFCREHLFRDDTERIIKALWQNKPPTSGLRLIELGCGPGFYSRKLAQRFPNIIVTGVDRSPSQVRSARERAAAENIRNCVFERVNALALPTDGSSFDILIASRIFTDRGTALRVLGIHSTDRHVAARACHPFHERLPRTKESDGSSTECIQ